MGRDVESEGEVPLIEDREGVKNLLGKIETGAPCSIDTEADSLYCHQEKLCLIQFSCEGRHALIDPLAIDDLGDLLEFVENRIVWLHGADYDMSIWKRTFGRLPKHIYDTQIAARLVGYRTFGLAHMIESFFDVQLSKKAQRANWGKRPLTEKMLEYAADDVRFILPMAGQLSDRLKELGRWEWFLQTCEHARQQVLDRPEKSPDEVWRINGWGKLSRRGLGFLRELWHWRDDLASKWDRPAFKVLGNDHLLEFSDQLAVGKTVKPPERFHSGIAKKFLQAIEKGRAVADGDLPTKNRGQRFSKASDWEVVYRDLKAVRDKKAKELDIETSLIGSRALLEHYAYADERTQEVRDRLFLPWQQALLFEESPV